MNKTGFILAICLMILTCNHFLSAQGCSDAGVCTAGSLHPGSDNDTSAKLIFVFSTAYAIGEEGTTIISPQVEMNWAFLRNAIAQLKVPYHFISGDLTDLDGVGDISINLSYLFETKGSVQTSCIAGIKIPAGKADILLNNESLPMVYQTSLGTFDVLAGIKLEINTWQLSAGYQHPVSSNENGFYPYAGVTYPAKNDGYFYSFHLKRKPDAIFRIAKQLEYKQWSFIPGALVIYHLSDDEVSDISGNEFKANGSQGLTLNGTGMIRYKANEKISIGLSAGMPFIVRDVRPDGLTRELVTNFEMAFKF
jgi:hypothetical protein